MYICTDVYAFMTSAMSDEVNFRCVIPVCLLEPKVIILNATAVINQVYYQVYITYEHQLHVSAISSVVIFRLDTIFIRVAV